MRSPDMDYRWKYSKKMRLHDCLNNIKGFCSLFGVSVESLDNRCVDPIIVIGDTTYSL